MILSLDSERIFPPQRTPGRKTSTRIESPLHAIAAHVGNAILFSSANHTISGALNLADRSGLAIFAFADVSKISIPPAGLWSGQTKQM
ncbi:MULTISPECIES: hypothetical protein [Mesorhizobium]|uniref:Uncharacterized protein n=1 Tax=Mesorhizobium shonense TaxID=1209948 RepID=A0ABV2HP23_9HYPH|nr:hypothetical protein [Mesorhizobium sp.]RWA66910.1 MAG: hypothetical protein EOQ29_25085 [Mesorhizobium sp.]RWA86731.1 MAG: hypothetical protein EOQ30_00245 [Mesorhizobium sp.]RWB21259.1 MAG: hypothetical protein EOQ40_10680 [Mesorhizobium sp.]RWE00628.1 MAG: hypothetical protein EOS40_14655 [Mesorhizobium sp.]TIS50977.1 MAG: hypothetical protein E5W96_04715 [Mesorhizobium sp.]